MHLVCNVWRCAMESASSCRGIARGIEHELLQVRRNLPGRPAPCSGAGVVTCTDRAARRSRGPRWQHAQRRAGRAEKIGGGDEPVQRMPWCFSTGDRILLEGVAGRAPAPINASQAILHDGLSANSDTPAFMRTKISVPRFYRVSGDRQSNFGARDAPVGNENGRTAAPPAPPAAGLTAAKGASTGHRWGLPGRVTPRMNRML